MNLHKKLIEIRKAVPYLQKIENNADQGFKYNSSSQVLAITRREMDKHGVLLKPDIKGHIFHHKAITKASMHHTELEMTFTWIDAEDPKDTIVCDWYSQGCDQHEKGVGKALTYAEKFFILKFNNIATDKDDPDAFEKRLENGTPGTDAKTPAPGKSSNVCPKCGVQAIIKGREEYGGGWLCFEKKGGCGEKFADDPTKQPSTKVPPKAEKTEPKKEVTKPSTKPADSNGKPLNATQIGKIVHMAQQLESPISARDIQAMVDGYCAEHGGGTYENGKHILDNFHEVLNAHIDKATGDTSKTEATAAIDKEFGDEG